MLIYILLILFLLFISLIPQKYDKITVPVAVIFMMFLGFFRANTVGTDIVVYTVNFVGTTANPISWNQGTEFEIGFNYLIVFFKTYISTDPMIFFGCIFIVFMLGILHLFKRYSIRMPLALFFLVTLGFYTMSFNIMRQLFGFGIICFLLPTLMDKGKYILSILYIVVIAYLFHRMLNILILLPIMEFMIGNKFLSKIFTKRNIIIALVLSLIIFTQASKIQGLLVYIASNILNLNERYLMHLSALAQRDSSFLVTVMQTLFCGYVVIISKKVKNIYLLAYVMGILITNILGGINPLFIRVGALLTFFAIIYFTFLWYNIKEPKVRFYFRLFSCIYSITYIMNSLIKNFGDVVPYENRLF